jgi:hypothetical protein
VSGSPATRTARLSLLEYAVDLAKRLRPDQSACWHACQTATEAIADLIDAQYENS